MAAIQPAASPPLLLLLLLLFRCERIRSSDSGEPVKKCYR
jgi:hypothetical protein